ncbi:MAG: adenylyl-sulfate kinase, partial [Candidatus Moraniibacteriota bacterium]
MSENKNLKGFVLWFTGLSGAGKSTIADEVYKKLKKNGNKI